LTIGAGAAKHPSSKSAPPQRPHDDGAAPPAGTAPTQRSEHQPRAAPASRRRERDRLAGRCSARTTVRRATQPGRALCARDAQPFHVKRREHPTFERVLPPTPCGCTSKPADRTPWRRLGRARQPWTRPRDHAHADRPTLGARPRIPGTTALEPNAGARRIRQPGHAGRAGCPAVLLKPEGYHPTPPTGCCRPEHSQPRTPGAPHERNGARPYRIGHRIPSHGLRSTHAVLMP
jgi:hypothetical protein